MRIVFFLKFFLNSRKHESEVGSGGARTPETAGTSGKSNSDEDRLMVDEDAGDNEQAIDFSFSQSSAVTQRDEEQSKAYKPRYSILNKNSSILSKNKTNVKS